MQKYVTFGKFTSERINMLRNGRMQKAAPCGGTAFSYRKEIILRPFVSLRIPSKVCLVRLVEQVGTN